MEIVVSDSIEVESSAFKEIGDDAIWTLSSAKCGSGIEQLRDNNLDTYWQSDGAHPHWINIQFISKAEVAKLVIYLDFKKDESYTPKKICLRTGTCVHDLVDLTTFEVHEPIGWVNVSLAKSGGLEVENPKDEYLQTFLLQVRIHTMHQGGRDAHVRLVKVYGPRSQDTSSCFVAPAALKSKELSKIQLNSLPKSSTSLVPSIFSIR